MASNDMTDQIVDGFMRYVRKTPHLENVSITVAYATKLCQRIKAAHKRELAELRECLQDACATACSGVLVGCKGTFAYDSKCCLLAECEYHKWRKALEGGNNEGK